MRYSGRTGTVGKKRKKRRTGLGLTAIVVLMICSVVSFRRVSLKEEQKRVTKEYELAKYHYEQEQTREEELKELKRFVQTKKFYEEIARSKFGLVYENEILFQAED